MDDPNAETWPVCLARLQEQVNYAIVIITKQSWPLCLVPTRAKKADSGLQHDPLCKSIPRVTPVLFLLESPAIEEGKRAPAHAT